MKLKYIFQIDFYKYLYYKIRRNNLSQYVFIDFRTLFFLLIIFSINIILFYPRKLTIQFPEHSNQITTLEILIRTLSIFVSIIFSFILLSFNIFYKNFGRFAFLSFFQNRLIKSLFTIFLVTIGFMIYSIIYLKEIEGADKYSTSLFVTSLTLTIVTVLLIFPTAIILLRQSQNRDNILNIIKQFDSEWTMSYYENVIWDKKLSHKHFQKDPVTLLTEIGTVAIKEYDQVTIQTIIQGFEDFFEKSLTKKSASFTHSKK